MQKLMATKQRLLAGNAEAARAGAARAEPGAWSAANAEKSARRAGADGGKDGKGGAKGPKGGKGGKGAKGGKEKLGISWLLKCRFHETFRLLKPIETQWPSESHTHT